MTEQHIPHTPEQTSVDEPCPTEIIWQGPLMKQQVGNLDEFEMVTALHDETGEVCPPQLANLKGKNPRFTGCCKKEDMEQVVFDLLK